MNQTDPTAAVWSVLGADGIVHGYYATLDHARTGSIDCWQKNEPACPEYSWQQVDCGWELLAGGYWTGVYLTEHTIHGQPAVSAVVSPPTDRAELRDRIAKAARTVRLRLGPNATAMAQRGEPVILNMGEADDLADAVLAVLPEPTSRAAGEVDADTVADRAAKVITTMGADIRALTGQRDRYRTAWRSARERAQAHAEGTLRHVADRDVWKREHKAEHARHVAVVGALVTDRAAVHAEALGKAADALPDADLPFVSPMGRRQTADWLRRLAVEHGTGAQQQDVAEAEPESCAHCGKTIRRITGTLAEWWVHVAGGQAFCYPWQPAKSPRATPKPAPVEQQAAAADGEETRVVPCSRAVLKRHHESHGWYPQPGMDPVDCPGYGDA